MKNLFKHSLAFISAFIMIYAVTFMKIASNVPQLFFGIFFALISLFVFVIYENQIRKNK